MHEPWMKFFTGDHLRDSGVRSVSLAARGLWTDMLCLMHQSVRKGYLQHPSGSPVTPEQLARMAGASVDETTGLLRELEDSGVFSRTSDGVIYSRRMNKEARKSALCSEAGKRGGGNPHAKARPLNGTLKGEVKGELKGDSLSEVRSQKSEVRSQKAEGEEGKPSPASALVEAWNGIGLAQVVKLTAGRTKSVNARLSEPFFRENYVQGLAMVKESKFLTGGNDRGWKADFDWFIQPDALAKVLEGKYADKKVRKDPVTGRVLR